MTATGKVIQVGARPQAVAKGFGGRYFVTVLTASAEPRGGVKVLDGVSARDFSPGMDQPQGLCFTGKLLIVADVNRVWRVDDQGGRSLLADEDDFPRPPRHFTDVACAPGGKAVYVADCGPEPGDPHAPGRIYRIGLDYKISIAVEGKLELVCPGAVSAPARGQLLIADHSSGTVFRARGKILDTLATGLPGATGLEQDARGTIYLASGGKLWRLPRASGSKPATPAAIFEGFQSPADVLLDRQAGVLLVPDSKAGTVTFVPLPT
jgi:gluconolactonase